MDRMKRDAIRASERLHFREAIWQEFDLREAKSNTIEPSQLFPN